MFDLGAWLVARQEIPHLTGVQTREIVSTVNEYRPAESRSARHLPGSMREQEHRPAKRSRSEVAATQVTVTLAQVESLSVPCTV